ncbi:MAG: ATP-binding protein, partial [Bacilli bacterium]|nr:ATP-binding protein [Bacilli bacterium]
GKTTLLDKKYRTKGFSYVTLDNSADRLLAKNDPKSFLELHPCPLIIDEAQKAVELFPELEHLINEKRRLEGNDSANGMYILSGSSRRDLLEKAKESLAGRAAILDMSSLSINEIYDRENTPFVPNVSIFSKKLKQKVLSQDEILKLIVKGQLPALYDDQTLQSPIFYSSYIDTYLDKDIKEQIELKDELKFYNLLTLVASLTGQELVYENLAKQVGVSANTIKSWISIMSKTGVIYLLQPYYEESWTKRVVKRPKIYFFDTGVACHLLGIDSKETLKKSFLKGHLFETLVVNEIRKTYMNDGEKIKIFYYRDSNQNEVDFVLIRNGTIYCFDAKLGKEFNLGDVSSFKELNDTKYEKGKGAIICTSEQISALSEKVLVVPISAI